jgi:hypothetical protein
MRSTLGKVDEGSSPGRDRRRRPYHARGTGAAGVPRRWSWCCWHRRARRARGCGGGAGNGRWRRSRRTRSTGATWRCSRRVRRAAWSGRRWRRRGAPWSSTTRRRGAWTRTCRWWCRRSTPPRRWTGAGHHREPELCHHPAGGARWRRCTGWRRCERVIVTTFQSVSGAGQKGMATRWTPSSPAAAGDSPFTGPHRRQRDPVHRPAAGRRLERGGGEDPGGNAQDPGPAGTAGRGHVRARARPHRPCHLRGGGAGTAAGRGGCARGAGRSPASSCTTTTADPLPLAVAGADDVHVGHIRVDPTCRTSCTCGSWRTTCARARRRTPCRSPSCWQPARRHGRHG